MKDGYYLVIRKDGTEAWFHIDAFDEPEASERPRDALTDALAVLSKYLSKGS